MDNKTQKNITIEELRIERARYDSLVQNQILSLDINTKYHKKIQGFIYITIFLGGVFTWSSSGEGSNIYSLISSIVDFIKKYIPEINAGIFVSIVIMTLLMIPVFAICVSAKNIRKKIDIETVLFYHKQNNIFKDFIKGKIKEKENIEIDSVEELLNLIKNKDVYDISFTISDFDEYLRKRFEIHKIDFGSRFYDDFANLILLNQCIDNTLVLVDSSTNSTFTLILSDNYSLL